MNFLHVFTLLVIDIHQNKFISLFLTPFIGLEILIFSGMVSARQLTICLMYENSLDCKLSNTGGQVE